MSVKQANYETFKEALAAVAIYREADQRKGKSEEPVFLDEACKLTGYKKNTIYSLISRKQIPYHKAASGKGKVFFMKSELLAWLGLDQKKEVVI